jgi:hypothetical protein
MVLMARVTTREASEQIANLQPFTTNGSLRGEWQGNAYVVTSYSTAIAYVNPTEGVALLNGQRYSVTTSNHQGQARRGVRSLSTPLEVTELETARDFLERISA